MKTVFLLFTIVLFSFLLSGCSPEVGSVEWCEKMDETPKGEWSMNDVAEYAENCVFRKAEDK